MRGTWAIVSHLTHEAQRSKALREGHPARTSRSAHFKSQTGSFS